MHRALSPVIGVVLLVVLAVILAISVGLAVPMTVSEAPPTATLSVAVEADEQRVAITHEGGDTIDASELDVSVRVDGQALRHQPPVPFFAASGFVSGPEGPFNSAGDPTWRSGQTASFSVAKTNDPPISPGAEVAVRVSTPEGIILETTVTAE